MLRQVPPKLFGECSRRLDRKLIFLRFLIQAPESTNSGQALCGKADPRKKKTRPFKRELTKTSQEIIKTCVQSHGKTSSGGTPRSFSGHLTPTRHSPSRAAPWLTPCPWQRRSVVTWESVSGWDTMPLPTTSDADSTLSLASCTMADTVSLAKTLRTVAARRNRAGHHAVIDQERRRLANPPLRAS